MSLLQQIKSDQIAARKAKDTQLATILTTLYSEAANVGLDDGKRESTDAEVTAVIKKFLKGVNESIEASGGTVEALVYERQILEQYLPQQMSEDDLRMAILEICAEGAKNIGAVMAGLKNGYAGLYDGKLASQIAKEVLGS